MHPNPFNNCLKAAMCTIGFCVAITTAAEASVYNVVNDFSGAANPGGVFSYGYYSGSAFRNTALSINRADYAAHYNNNGPYVLWTGVDRYSSYSWPNEVLLLDPSFSGLATVVRFTAPAADVYDIAGYFVGLDYATTVVYVIADAFTPDQSILISNSISGMGSVKEFSVSRYLNDGGSVDFVVGSNGGVTYDATGLSATITGRSNGVPEPPTMLIIATCIAGLAVSRGRNRGQAEQGSAGEQGEDGSEPNCAQEPVKSEPVKSEAVLADGSPMLNRRNG